MEKEYCEICGNPTGKCGANEDSLNIVFSTEILGPLCEQCYEAAVLATKMTAKQIRLGYTPDFDDSKD